MQTIPQLIQELEEQLSHAKGIAKGAILLDLMSLYGSNRQLQKLEEGTEELLKLAEEHQDIELKMEVILLFVKIHYAKNEFDKTYTFFNQIKSLNEKENNRKIWLQYYLLKADIAQKQEQFEVAHAHLQEALACISPKDILMQVKINQLLGIQQTMNNNLEQAFSYFFKGLEWAENAENKSFKHYTQTIALLLNITSLYSRKLEGFENSDSLSYYMNKALKLALDIQYKPAIIDLQLQFAGIETQSKNYDKALDYLHSALKVAKTFQNQYIVTYCNDSIAIMYQRKGEFDKAIDMFQSNLDSALKMNSKALIISSFTNLSRCFYKQKNHSSALKHAEEALSVAEELNIEVSCLPLYKLMASLHKELGNIDEAFHFIQKHMDLKDEMYTAEKEKSIVEMQTRYETEKKEQEAEQLRVLEQVKSRFFSQITHEFRTPLTLILGPVQQLLQHPKIQSDSELQNRLTLVERNGERLSNLVNQLLDLSKLESGKMTIQKKHGDVIAFAKAIVTNFQTLTQQQNIHLHFETSILQLTANFDVDKLEKILYNLLSNAFKFTPSNGEITLELQTQQSIKEKHTNLKITLKDTGKGIAAAQLPHIFDRFYQADNSNIREVEGSGVGLSLVKELIELQGGSIEVKSEINVGTTFICNLPLELSEVHQIISIAEKTPAPSSSVKTLHTKLKDASSNKQKTKATTKNKGKNIENENPVPIIRGILKYCASDHFTTLDAGNWASYQWSNGETSRIIEANAGTYTVTVTNSNDCTGTDEVTVTENANPVPVITGDFAYCRGRQATLDAGVWETYAWSNGETVQSFSTTSIGVYTVTITNQEGCTGTAMAEVSATPCLAEAGILTTNQNTICAGEALEVSSTGNQTDTNYRHYFFVYSQDNLGNTLYQKSSIANYGTGTATASFGGLSAGDYLVCSYNECKDCLPNPSPVIFTTPMNDIYQTGTIQDGCFDIECVEVSVPEAFEPHASGTGIVAANNAAGQTIFVAEVCGGTMPYSIEFESAGGFVTVNDYPSPVAGCLKYQVLYVPEAEWTLTVTDANGCHNETVVFTNEGLIEESPLQIVSHEIGAESCSGYADGSISITVEGGSDDCNEYTYEWSGPNSFVSTVWGAVTGNEVTGLASGKYDVTVTDCEGTTTTLEDINVTRKTRGRGRGRGGCKTIDGENPIENSVLGVYPNPFGAQTSIEFSLSESSKVWLSVYSVDGRKVVELLKGEEIEGELLQRMDFDAEQLQEGLYILEMRTESGERFYQKLMVNK